MLSFIRSLFRRGPSPPAHRIQRRLDGVKASHAKYLMTQGKDDAAIALVLNVAPTTIRDVRIGYTWRHAHAQPMVLPPPVPSAPELLVMGSSPRPLALPRKKPTRLTPAQEGQLYRDYLEGKYRSDELGLLYSVSRTTVNRVVKQERERLAAFTQRKGS
jgi:hypothetical protein